MEFEIGKEYKFDTRVKVMMIPLKLVLTMIFDTDTTFHGYCSGALKYSFENGVREGDTMTYEAIVNGKKTISVATVDDEGNVSGTATSEGMKPNKFQGSLIRE